MVTVLGTEEKARNPPVFEGVDAHDAFPLDARIRACALRLITDRVANRKESREAPRKRANDNY